MQSERPVRQACYTVIACLLLGACGTQPFDPDCTAEKAARSTAMKATVGVGGRCTPKEALSDTIERNTEGE